MCIDQTLFTLTTIFAHGPGGRLLAPQNNKKPPFCEQRRRPLLPPSCSRALVWGAVLLGLSGAL